MESFLQPPDESSFSNHFDSRRLTSSNLRRRGSVPGTKLNFSVMDTAQSSEKSSIIDQIDDQGDVYEGPVGPLSQLQEPAPSTDWYHLESFSRQVIRAIEFQVRLMFSFIKFPSWFVYSCLLFVSDPYRTMSRGRRYLLSRAVPILDMGLEDYEPFLKVMSRLGWSLLRAVYVGIILISLLLFAFMISGFMMSNLVREPLVIKESLNFDYTKNSPEAYVPITSCAGVDYDSRCTESLETSGKIGESLIIPPNQNTEITVSLTLPESEYNRNLGMFQVRVDFLSANGQILGISRHPCMVRFRSEPIRLAQTFLKIAPLVTGYASEIQTIELKLKGFEETVVPTACFRIMIEQRAEFLPGAGVPEIYEASMLFKHELSFFNRLIWNWRKTLFVWLSMSLFTMELFLALAWFIILIKPKNLFQQRNFKSGSR